MTRRLIVRWLPTAGASVLFVMCAATGDAIGSALFAVILILETMPAA